MRWSALECFLFSQLDRQGLSNHLAGLASPFPETFSLESLSKKDMRQKYLWNQSTLLHQVKLHAEIKK